MTGKKIIVLIGRSGQGKSALANVLSGQENNFKESEKSKSETKEIQTVEFEYDNQAYQIVDSIGIGDTSLAQSQVLHEIAKGYKIIENGVHQVLFVNGERFTPEEIETYNMLKKTFFNTNVDKYTTIIRTKFPSFEEDEECEQDIKLLLAENNPAITNMINSCNGIIHIDNPSINIKGRRGERDNPRNKEVRQDSRAKLLEHLVKWKKEDKEDCKPKSLKDVEKSIRSSAKDENEKLKEEIKTIKNSIKGEELSQKEKTKLEEDIKKLEQKIKNNEALVQSNNFLAFIECQIL